MRRCDRRSVRRASRRRAPRREAWVNSSGLHEVVRTQVGHHHAGRRGAPACRIPGSPGHPTCLRAVAERSPTSRNRTSRTSSSTPASRSSTCSTINPGCRPVPRSETPPARQAACSRFPEARRGIIRSTTPPASRSRPGRSGRAAAESATRIPRRNAASALRNRPEGVAGDFHAGHRAQDRERRPRGGQPHRHGRIVVGGSRNHVLARFEQVDDVLVGALHQCQGGGRVDDAVRVEGEDLRLRRGRCAAHRRQADQFADVLAVLVRAEHLDPHDVEIG
ncbi:hypothetical protein NG2371_03732 [Nocardia gamkensis]|nr:hypothetical protein [Nocardia gamkensis]